MSESVLIALIGFGGIIVGAVASNLVSAWLNRRKNKAEEADKFASAANESITALSNLQELYDSLVEREKKREKELEAEIEIRRKSFDRIYTDFTQLREEKRFGDEQNLELIRSKNGEILVLNHEIKELQSQALQWKAEASGLRVLQGALQDDIKALKQTTGELKLKQDQDNEKKSI